jgi:hypothetical protein
LLARYANSEGKTIQTLGFFTSRALALRYDLSRVMPKKLLFNTAADIILAFYFQERSRYEVLPTVDFDSADRASYYHQRSTEGAERSTSDDIRLSIFGCQ